MWLEKLHLTYFKSYEERGFTFGERVNCLVGENGSGKTNLLDAIYFLTLTKSAFHNQDALGIRHAEDFFYWMEFLKIQEKIFRSHAVFSVASGKFSWLTRKIMKG